MAKTNDVIALNGKYYDVASGTLLSDQATPPRHVDTMRHVEVVKRPRLHHADSAAAPATPRANGQLAHHKPARSTTLMRHAVKQPAVLAKPDFKPQAPLDHAIQKRLNDLPAVVPKMSSNRVDRTRADHAATTRHSDMVRRFANAPAYGHHRPGQTVSDIRRPAARPAAERPAAQTQPRPVRQSAPVETDVFSQALAAAASHAHATPQRPAKRKSHSRRKVVGAAVAAAIVLAFGGVALLNRPALEVQFASMRAGFPATLPGYQPEGFSAKGLEYAPGAVTVGFQGPNNQAFDVAQKRSNWDSQTLLDNYVATSDQSYQAYQANGRTVFVYGDNAATWVNGGVWYQLKGNLSSDEMIKVASTM